MVAFYYRAIKQSLQGIVLVVYLIYGTEKTENQTGKGDRAGRKAEKVFGKFGVRTDDVCVQMTFDFYSAPVA